MKKIAVLMMLTWLMLTMVGCSKIDKNESHVANSNDGAWELTTYGIQGFEVSSLGALPGYTKYVNQKQNVQVTYTIYTDSLRQDDDVQTRRDGFIDSLNNRAVMYGVSREECEKYAFSFVNDEKEIYGNFYEDTLYYYIPIDDEYINYVEVQVIDWDTDEINYKDFEYLTNSEMYDVTIN